MERDLTGLFQAFVLTKGKTHYRTTNRGETWQSFDMPMQPALVSAPLSFHADKDKYGHILYQGTKCEGWYGGCHDEVCRLRVVYETTGMLVTFLCL